LKLFGISLKCSFFFLFFLAFTLVNAQDHPYTWTKNQKARDLFSLSTHPYVNKNFDLAENYLLKSLQEDPKYVGAMMRLAMIYHQKKNYTREEELYKNVLKIRSDFPEVYYQYGTLLFVQKRYDEAGGYFDTYMRFIDIPTNKRADAGHYKNLSTFRAKAMKNPVPFKPVNLGSRINTRVSEYWPTLTADEQIMYFTRRLQTFVGPNKDSLKNEDIFASVSLHEEWQEPFPIPGYLNSDKNEGAITISPDGKFLIFTGCHFEDTYGRCDLYYSRYQNGKWMKPRNIGSPVNTAHKETQPSLSFDGNTLYFSSDRPGTFGELDIWKSQRINDSTWAEPINLGDKVNTIGNEMCPFIHLDNKTLFFSSDYHTGMGNDDLFVSKKNEEGVFTNVVNLGFPINTHKDEFSLFVTTTGTRAFFASNVEKGYGELDIYSFELHENVRPNPVKYLKGFVYDKDSKEKLKAKFQLIDVESGELILEYYSEEQTGAYLNAIPADKNYAMNVSKKDYMFYSDRLAIKGEESGGIEQDIPMSKIKKGAKTVLNNIFFDFDSYEIQKESYPELEKVIEFLNTYPNVRIEISGHTDSKGSDTYNMKLAENRAIAVYNYLQGQGNIDPQRLSYTSYGKRSPIASNIDDEGRAINRRTEFSIIEM
jgi:outer membrane protein OmpA-like peptidoglycan-associated protein/tetratricopeptide (TPR) repeat protein